MYKLLSLDNKESRGQSIIGKEHNFNYDGYNFYFGDIRSSRVESIVIIEQKIMTVKTKNSTYIFERIQ